MVIHRGYVDAHEEIMAILTLQRDVYLDTYVPSADDFAQFSSDVSERRTLFSGLVPAGLDQLNQRLSEFRRLRQHRSVRDAFAVTYTVHHVYKMMITTATDF